jgi:hypothetical protein
MTVSVLLCFKSITSRIHVRHVKGHTNFLYRVHTSQDMNLCFQTMAVKSPLVEKWATYFYCTWLVFFAPNENTWKLFEVKSTKSHQIFCCVHRSQKYYKKIVMKLVSAGSTQLSPWPKIYIFLLMKLGSIWVGTLMLTGKVIRAVLIWDRFLKYSFIIRRLVCGTPYCCMNSR